MARYRFLTTWLLNAPRERAWDVLERAEVWPKRWRGVERVEVLAEGDEHRVGRRFRIAWRSRIPYELEFEFTVRTVEPPHTMAGDAEGELSGTGCWRLFEGNGLTAVLYDWDVTTSKGWMNALAPIARPVFEYNHDAVMRWGAEGLAQRLDARLVAAG